jgi:hypothetical protein
MPEGTTLPPSGKTTNNAAMVFARVRDGKIVEENAQLAGLVEDRVGVPVGQDTLNPRPGNPLLPRQATASRPPRGGAH